MSAHMRKPASAHADNSDTAMHQRMRLALCCSWELEALGTGLAIEFRDDPGLGITDYCREALLARHGVVVSVQMSLLDEPDIDIWLLRERMVGREAARAERKKGTDWWITKDSARSKS